MGGSADDEIPLPLMLFYLFRDVEFGRPHGCAGSGFKCGACPARSTRKTTSGGEFGWGGTSVKR